MISNFYRINRARARAIIFQVVQISNRLEKIEDIYLSKQYSTETWSVFICRFFKPYAALAVRAPLI